MDLTFCQNKLLSNDSMKPIFVNQDNTLKNKNRISGLKVK